LNFELLDAEVVLQSLFDDFEVALLLPVEFDVEVGLRLFRAEFFCGVSRDAAYPGLFDGLCGLRIEFRICAASNRALPDAPLSQSGL